MPYETESKTLRSGPITAPGESEEVPVCSPTPPDGPFPLCLSPNADVWRLANAPSPMVPLAQRAALRSDANVVNVPHVVMPSAPAIHSSQSPDENSLTRQEIIDQSGFFVAPVCKMVWRTPDNTTHNIRIQGYVELTKKHPDSNQREVILTASAGTTMRNPLGAGAVNYRYSVSTHDERAGNNYVLQTTNRRYGVGAEDSKTQGQSLSIWGVDSPRRPTALGISMGDELFRIDVVTSMSRFVPWLAPRQYLRALPVFRNVLPSYEFDLKCGGDFVVFSPGLKLIPGYSTIGQFISGVLRLGDRIENNRQHYEHEDTIPEFIGSIFGPGEPQLMIAEERPTAGSPIAIDDARVWPVHSPGR